MFVAIGNIDGKAEGTEIRIGTSTGRTYPIHRLKFDDTGRAEDHGDGLRQRAIDGKRWQSMGKGGPRPGFLDL